MFDSNQFKVPVNMLCTPMVAMNNPNIFVKIPIACSPTNFMILLDILRMTQVIANATILAIIVANSPFSDEKMMAAVITPGPVNTGDAMTAHAAPFEPACFVSLSPKTS